MTATQLGLELLRRPNTDVEEVWVKVNNVWERVTGVKLTGDGRQAAVTFTSESPAHEQDPK